MATQQAAVPAAVTTSESRFLSSGATAYRGPILAVPPEIPVLALLEHANYILGAVGVFTEVIVDTSFRDSAEASAAADGIHYLAQLAHGMVNASVEALAEGAQS